MKRKENNSIRRVKAHKKKALNAVDLYDRSMNLIRREYLLIRNESESLNSPPQKTPS